MTTLDKTDPLKRLKDIRSHIGQWIVRELDDVTLSTNDALWMHGLALDALSSLPTQAVGVPTLKKHLSDHWLTGVTCDHDAKTDTAACSCSMWRDEPHPSVGAAVEAWIEHMFATLPVAPPQPAAVAVTDEMVERVYNAVFSCGHTIVADEITLRRVEGKDGNALKQLSDRITVALRSTP